MYPVALQLGPLAIRFYGLMYALAIVIGVVLLKREVKRKGWQLSEDNLMNFVFIVVVAGILSARAYYVLFNWRYYWANPLEIPAIWHGGLAIHGALLGGIGVGIWFARRHHLSFWALADLVAPVLVLGQTFGRFGNFMNGDAHGVPTSMPWGVIFPPASIAGSQFGQVPLHPTMLYEMVIDFAIFLYLWKIRTRPCQDGFVFSLYVILYSLGRFVVSLFRADDLMIGTLRAPHVISFILIVLFGGYLLSRQLWHPLHDGGRQVGPRPPRKRA